LTNKFLVSRRELLALNYAIVKEQIFLPRHRAVCPIPRKKKQWA